AGRSPEEAAERLVDMACERGGHDNITVAVITAGERAAEHDPSYVPERYEAVQGAPPVAIGGRSGAESSFPGAEERRNTPVPAGGGLAYASGAPVALDAPPARRGSNGWLLGIAVVVLLGILGVFALVALVALAVGMNWVTI